MFNPYNGFYRRNSAAPFSLSALVSGPESPKYNTVNFPLHGRASASALYSAQHVEAEDDDEDETMLHRMGRKLSLLKLLPRRSQVEKADTVALHIGMKTEVEVLREEMPRKNSRTRPSAGASTSQSSLRKGKIPKEDGKSTSIIKFIHDLIP
jgi:hypothetical protein